MKKSKAIVFVCTAVAGLIMLALVFDRSRLIADERELVSQLGQQIEKQEERIISAVVSLPSQSSSISEAVAVYRAAPSGAERRTQFQEVQTLIQRALAAQNDTHNLALRRLTDEIHGALNRREILMPQYEQHSRKLKQASQGTLGTLAALF